MTSDGFARLAKADLCQRKVREAGAPASQTLTVLCDTHPPATVKDAPLLPFFVALFRSSQSTSD